jgi:uncharacterized protein (DUF983 family)
MALIECKECGKQISSEARSCPSCGYEMKPHPLEQRDLENLIGLVIAVVGAVIIFGGIYLYARATF